MTKKTPAKFYPLIDVSTLALFAFIIVIAGWPIFIDPGWLMTSINASCILLCIIPFFSIWYEIDDEELIVYSFWRPTKFPISKIKDISTTSSLLAAPATSLTRRLAITFKDKSVLKSTTPLIISPSGQRRFLQLLLDINPDIKIKVNKFR